jgi:hypothetical protein
MRHIPRQQSCCCAALRGTQSAVLARGALSLRSVAPARHCVPISRRPRPLDCAGVHSTRSGPRPKIGRRWRCSCKPAPCRHVASPLPSQLRRDESAPLKPAAWSLLRPAGCRPRLNRRPNAPQASRRRVGVAATAPSSGRPAAAPDGNANTVRLGRVRMARRSRCLRARPRAGGVARGHRKHPERPPERTKPHGVRPCFLR